MSDHPAPDWDPRAFSVLSDQRRAYDEMRERCPVAYSDFLEWTLFRHHDIVDVVADPTTYSSVSKHLAIPNGMDPPVHARYRHALDPYFQHDQMAEIESLCRSIAAGLVQGIRGDETGGAVEFVSAFAQPFALRVLCAFLGWPDAMWENLRGWTHGNQEASFWRDKQAGIALAHEFAGFVTTALDVRRAAGGNASDDLTTSLMRTSIDGTALSDKDIVSILRNWTAGHGTVVAGLGILVFHLASDMSLQRRLREEPALLGAAVDEILRADGPLVANRRTTMRDVRIEDRAIGAGEKLSLNWIAANRDGRVFDDPDVIRLDRDQQENLLFGAGIHYCLGAPAARLEMRVALQELLALTSAIQLAAGKTPRREVYPSDGFRELPVTLG